MRDKLRALLIEPENARVCRELVETVVKTWCAPAVLAMPELFSAPIVRGTAWQSFAELAPRRRNLDDFSAPVSDLARALAAAGAPINACDERRGGTPLHVAVSRDSSKTSTLVVRLLLDHGADPTIKDGRGWTPLVAARNAVKRDCGERDEIIALLMAATARKRAERAMASNLAPVAP
jgi:hypothetical protein